MTAQYKCPKCGSQDKLTVLIEQWALLIQEEEDNFQTDTDSALVTDRDHFWNEYNAAHCVACGYAEVVDYFISLDNQQE